MDFFEVGWKEGKPFDPFDKLRAGRLRTLRAVSGKQFICLTNFLIL